MSFDLVDAAVQTTRAVQHGVAGAAPRVVVYLLLAVLFAEIGYRQVWARLTAGLDPATVATPGSSALSQALCRVGVAPLRELFTLVRGPAVGAARWQDAVLARAYSQRLRSHGTAVKGQPANAINFAR